MKINEDDLIREVCRESFAEFVKEFWDEINPVSLVWNWHMDFLCETLQTSAERFFKGLPCEKDIIINISPGTSKSTICSQMFPAWLWTRQPSCCVIGASYSQSIAMNNSRKQRDVVQSQKYIRIFGVKIRKDQNAKSHFMNEDNGYRYAVGVGGSITGMHGDFLIVDDPLNPLEANSDKELENANCWMQETLPSRKINKLTAVTILIMQRLHENDCTGMLLAQSRKRQRNDIDWICLPAELSPNGTVNPPELASRYINGLMDPNRLGADALNTMRSRLGEYAYAGQFDQNPRPRDGALFAPENLITCAGLPEPIEKVVRYWDKAGSQGKGCYTAGVKLARLKSGAFIILDCVRGQWEPFRRNKIIRQTAELDGFACQVCLEQEPGSGGKESALISAKELAGYRVKLDLPTGDKTTRAEPLSSQIAAGNVYMLKGDWNKDFIDELRMFPNSSYKDQVDAAAAAFNTIAIRKGIDYKDVAGIGTVPGAKKPAIPEKLAVPYKNLTLELAGIKLPEK